MFITNTYELSSDQLSEVNERPDEIAKASGRLGRKDWLMAFSGAVFSLVLSDLISPQASSSSGDSRRLPGRGLAYGWVAGLGLPVGVPSAAGPCCQSLPQPGDISPAEPYLGECPVIHLV